MKAFPAEIIFTCQHLLRNPSAITPGIVNPHSTDMTRSTRFRHHKNPQTQKKPLSMLPARSEHCWNAFWAVVEAGNKFNGEVSVLWKFHILHEGNIVGYMHDDMIKNINWSGTSFVVDSQNREVHLYPEIPAHRSAAAACQEQFVSLLEINRHRLACLSRWKPAADSFFPITCQSMDLAGLQMPAPMRGMFGIVTYGVHLNIYTQRKDSDGQYETFVWVSKRSNTTTFPGMLDQAIAGGIDNVNVLDPLAELRREAQEEAGLTLNLRTRSMESEGKAIGTVKGPYQIKYYDQKDHQSRDEVGHLEPGVRFVFDLEVDEEFTPVPNNEKEINEFVLKSVGDVKNGLINQRWKPNSGLAMLASLIRAGFITPREANIDELLDGLQRQLPFQIVEISERRQ